MPIVSTFRGVQVLALTLVAALHLLVAANNVLDYETNFAFVSHVMSMDTTSPQHALAWRAIATPWMHHATYWVIIAWEFCVGLLALRAALMLRRASPDAARNHQSEAASIQALGIALTLWLGAFLLVGGEWFVMWQSPDWNGQSSAFRMTAIVMLALLLFIPRERAQG